MKRFWNAIKWDLFRQIRYNILLIAVLVTLIYMAILWLLPMNDYYLVKVVVFMIFNDPAALGMLFIGSLILFEKSDNTLLAQAVTPLQPKHYLWSKAITLTLIAVLCSLAMAFAAFGWKFNYLHLVLGVVLSSFVFTFLGCAVVAGCTSFNEYIIRVALILIPTALPFLNLWDITDTRLWYLVPSQASLILMEATFHAFPIGDLAYSYLYLLFWLWIAYRLAFRSYHKMIAR